MSLAIFDLDNTLLTADSDYEWGQFLVDKKLVDGKEYELKNQRFYDAYKAGTLDILEFLAFSLQPLAQIDRQTLDRFHEEFMGSKILPNITRQARNLVEKHRKQNDVLLIITATNSFVTAPIARELGISHLIATEPEVIDGQFTGRVSGTPCFREGKVTRLNDWCAEHNQDLQGSWFYSDSHNDLPLLALVDHPIAVDPDAALAKNAAENGWPVISLRDKK
jgi:HAD superfamily hydrolase (TIGR01490 family)